MWRIIDSTATGQLKEYRIEAQPGLTVNRVLRRLAESGVTAVQKEHLSNGGCKAAGERPTSIRYKQLVDGHSATLTCDGKVLDPAKRVEEDYGLRPEETSFYITSLPYPQPLRLYIIRMESGETTALEMWAEDKAVELQRQIQHRLGVEQNDMLLIHEGELVDPEKSFSEQFIGTGASVYLLLKSQQPPLPGGLPAPPGPGLSPRAGEPGANH